MTVRSGFFNDVNDDRVYDAADFADYFASFIGNGVFPNPSTGLQVFENGNMTTVIKPGKGWINGYYVHNDSDFIFQHDIADGLLKRIDRIVLQYSTADRKIDIILKKGTFASTPIAPTVIRDADFYELVLADVTIGAGTTQITQGNITDQRLNNNLCGIVHGVVNQVDTTTIFNQYQQWFDDYSVTKAAEFLAWQTDVTTALEDWIDAQEQGFEAWRQAEEQLYYTWLNGRKNEFDTWFATIKDKLSEDAAGNLFNLIDEHKDATLPHKYKDTTDGQTYLWGMQRNADLNAAAFMYAQNEIEPPNVINLPTWEQVDSMQMEIVTSSGRLAAKDGNMYKIKTVDDRSFLTPEGSNNLDALITDYQTRFPSIAPYIPIESSEKWHVRDEVYLIIHPNYIVIFNLATMKVINAVSIASLGNTNFAEATVPNYFVDDKYIYVRGNNAARVNWSIGVFDKNTGAWVRAIQFTGGSFPLSWNAPLSYTKLPCIDGIFFLTGGSDLNYIQTYAINYDVNGIPQSFASKLVHTTQGGSYTQLALFDDGQFIYDVYVHTTSLWYIRKSQYNKSTNTWTTIAIGTNVTAAPTSKSTWSHVYVKGAMTFAIVKFDTVGELILLRLDTLQQYQLVSNSLAHRQPTFDYTNRNKMWAQFKSIPTMPVTVNGNHYEVILELTMLDDGTWSTQYHWVPILYSSGINAPTRRISLGGFSIMKNGEVLVRNNAAQVMDSAKLKPIKLLEGYQV